MALTRRGGHGAQGRVRQRVSLGCGRHGARAALPQRSRCLRGWANGAAGADAPALCRQGRRWLCCGRRPRTDAASERCGGGAAYLRSADDVRHHAGRHAARKVPRRQCAERRPGRHERAAARGRARGGGQPRQPRGGGLHARPVAGADEDGDAGSRGGGPGGRVALQQPAPGQLAAAAWRGCTCLRSADTSGRAALADRRSWRAAVPIAAGSAPARVMLRGRDAEGPFLFWPGHARNGRAGGRQQGPDRFTTSPTAGPLLGRPRCRALT
jgi:hypothetical protein